MARIDIRDLDDDTIKELDRQCIEYGIPSRKAYLKLLIKLDILTKIVGNYVVEENKKKG
jgi:hypothetical protein